MFDASYLGCPMAHALWAVDSVSRGAWLFSGSNLVAILSSDFCIRSWPVGRALWAVDSVSRGAWLFFGHPPVCNLMLQLADEIRNKKQKQTNKNR